ncbi:pyridoxal phosphate-dependent aminotransferase [Agrobacterium fabrum]|uniref:Aminotransferase n=1 Tax=Agrobacterium fabrum TaxID=1176649 RepID=A0A7Z7BSC0_9HYPH|nr:histidinol-phosphate transaminase [Agrobacterium fabrum]MCR6727595.1 histidinol-phosphate aminotransferase family protein [Agrobacterium fabrum]WCK79998.1 histidinol-phosphate transaminase [Agrobacterium fabrum]WLP57519.1 histidinol-phosphate transaminase [Agrobacterium fabrum]CUX52536.1 putative Histidinol-phosphate aminotransferase [Agrobacterium fabrum str. J-07]SDB74515.1 histidinol-phosphate aminotransferase [Agrobacterium fabrum]
MSVSYDAGRVVEGTGWIALHKNENHFISPTWAERALLENANIRFDCYPDPFSSGIREELAKLYGVDSSNIYVGNGSDGVLADILALLRLRFERINLPDVGYKVYDILAARFNYGVRRYRNIVGEKEASSLSGLSVIDSPNAITGAIVPASLYKNIADASANFVIWDNCYGDFENRRLQIPNDMSNMAIVRSFSKYYGLAGLRIGYCIASPELVSSLNQIKDVYNVNGVAQAVAIRALTNPNEFEASAARMLQVRKQLQNLLSRYGFDFVEPHGNFIFTSHPKITGASLQKHFEDFNILVRRFDYPETENWLRITVPSEAHIERLADAVQSSTAAAECAQLSG